MHCAPRHPVHRGGVVLQPACGVIIHRPIRQESVTGYENILDHQGVAASALQPDNVPVVADLVIAQRHQEATEVDRATILDHRATGESPGCVITTRRPQPRAVDQIPAVDHRADAHRGI